MLLTRCSSPKRFDKQTRFKSSDRIVIQVHRSIGQRTWLLRKTLNAAKVSLAFRSTFSCFPIFAFLRIRVLACRSNNRPSPEVTP